MCAAQEAIPAPFRKKIARSARREAPAPGTRRASASAPPATRIPPHRTLQSSAHGTWDRPHGVYNDRAPARSRPRPVMARSVDNVRRGDPVWSPAASGTAYADLPTRLRADLHGVVAPDSGRPHRV